MKSCPPAWFPLFRKQFGTAARKKRPAPVLHGTGRWISRGSTLRFVLDVLVDGLGGSLAGAHGLDDGGRAGDGVAAGIDALAAGVAVVTAGDDAAVLVGLEAGGGGTDQEVGAGAQAHDDAVDLHFKLAAGHFDGAAAAGGVGLAQLHLDAADGPDKALVVGQDGQIGRAHV